jgi:uncharacterized membrane protein
MLTAGSDPAEIIRLKPHCSLSRRAAVGFFLSVCSVSLLIGGLFALQGYWPVLPFAGLEMLVLGVALRLSMRRGQNTEIIRISDDWVLIDVHTSQTDCSFEFPRHWAQVKLRRAKSPWHPSRLSIQSHGRVCELGGFLTEEARCALAKRLRRLIGGVSESPQLLQQDCNIKVQ